MVQYLSGLNKSNAQEYVDLAMAKIETAIDNQYEVEQDIDEGFDVAANMRLLSEYMDEEQYWNGVLLQAKSLID